MGNFGNKETARKGLKYIMSQRQQDYWEEDIVGDYIIYTVGPKGGEMPRYRVPLKNVEAAERDLDNEGIASRWVHTDITNLTKKKK